MALAQLARGRAQAPHPPAQRGGRVLTIGAPPPRPHPLARSKRVDRINRILETAWSRGWLTRPSLDPAVLLGQGQRGFAAEDEGGGRSAEDVADFRTRLGALGEALAGEAALNPLGLAMAHGQLVRIVRQRHALGRLWRERPALAESAIAPPIIVIGQMRSGTTRVQRLLASDPAHCGTRFCDSWHPVPARPDLRPLWSGLALFAARRINPWIDTLHPFGAGRTDEELGWLTAALSSCAFEAQWHVPSFVRFSETRDAAPLYREFARILCTDAAARGNAHRRRVLKVPQFAEDADALLARFPEASVVAVRRDPSDIRKSSVSLVANQVAVQSDRADIAAIEKECARKIALREARMHRALARWTGPLSEVEFTALQGDWEGEMRRVYRELGLPMGSEALAAMRAEQGRAMRSHHTRHAADYAAFFGPGPARPEPVN